MKIKKKHNLLFRKDIGKQNNKLDLRITFNLDNEQGPDQMKIAVSFSNYFVNIEKLTRQNDSKGNTSYTNYLDKSVINSMLMDKI